MSKIGQRQKKAPKRFIEYRRVQTAPIAGRQISKKSRTIFAGLQRSRYSPYAVPEVPIQAVTLGNEPPFRPPLGISLDDHRRILDWNEHRLKKAGQKFVDHHGNIFQDEDYHTLKVHEGDSEISNTSQSEDEDLQSVSSASLL